MVAKRSTKMGKVMPYIDVRSKSDVPQFESMLKMGPTIVLIYADWCGHCTRFKQNMWDEVAKSDMKHMNTAAVHYDMVENTSMNKTPIEGYPTLFEVKRSPKENTSKPVSTPQTKEELEKLIGTEMNENMKRGERMITNSTIASQNTFTPQPVESLPPDITEDEVAVKQTTVQSAVQAGGSKGGSLLETLLKVSADTAHAVVLAGSAIEISRRMKKRKHTKRKRSSTKQTRRR
jgi:thiol-disulfide isomerase/thioredoxin